MKYGYESLGQFLTEMDSAYENLKDNDFTFYGTADYQRYLWNQARHNELKGREVHYGYHAIKPKGWTETKSYVQVNGDILGGSGD